MALLDHFNMGWADIPRHLIQEELQQGLLIELQPFVYLQNQSYETGTVELIWTEKRQLGKAGQWLIERLSNQPSLDPS